MNSTSRSSFTPRIVFGLAIVFLGVLFLLDNLDLVESGPMLRWWPIFMIAIGISQFFSGANGQRGWGVFWTAAGSWVLAYNFDLTEHQPWDFWPLILVFVGLTMVWRAMRGHPARMRRAGPGPAVGIDGTASGPGDSASGSDTSSPSASGGPDAASEVHAFALLGSLERRIVSQEFRGGDATAIMAGCTIDLRSASIGTEPVILDVFAIWGGIEILVPEDWTVTSEVIPILGGFEDNTRPPGAGSPAGAGADGPGPRIVAGIVIGGGSHGRSEEAPATEPPPLPDGRTPSSKHLIIKGFLVMGGAEVRNWRKAR